MAAGGRPEGHQRHLTRGRGADRPGRRVPAGQGTGESGLDLLRIDPAVRAVLDRGHDEDLRDEPALAGERVLLVNSRAAGPAAGPGTRVFTLRDRTELAGALRERDDARDRVAALSGQAHEFANRMQTVITLMELGDTADATRAGVAALDRTRGPGAAVAAEVLDPVLAALLADKAWTADELGIAFTVTDDVDPGDLLGADARSADAPLGDHLPWAADDLVSLAGNLVDNALEAVSGQPRRAGADRAVTVTISLDGPRPAGPDSALVLRVSDTGPGIPADTVDDLFTYGFSTRGVDGGRPRGIGLALVDRITRRLGGTVEVTARTGEGATGTGEASDRGPADQGTIDSGDADPTCRPGAPGAGGTDGPGGTNGADGANGAGGTDGAGGAHGAGGTDGAGGTGTVFTVRLPFSPVLASTTPAVHDPEPRRHDEPSPDRIHAS